MTRRSHRAAIPFVAVLALAVVSATSQAAYLTAMGPKQCCKSHCGRTAAARDAASCCKTHLTVAPAAPTKVASITAAVLVPVAWLTAPPPLRVVRLHQVSFVEGRAPPGASLVAQHSSLLV